jgi:hypothetical protein
VEKIAFHMPENNRLEGITPPDELADADLTHITSPTTSTTWGQWSVDKIGLATSFPNPLVDDRSFSVSYEDDKAAKTALENVMTDFQLLLARAICLLAVAIHCAHVSSPRGPRTGGSPLLCRCYLKMCTCYVFISERNTADGPKVRPVGIDGRRAVAVPRRFGQAQDHQRLSIQDTDDGG